MLELFKIPTDKYKEHIKTVLPIDLSIKNKHPKFGLNKTYIQKLDSHFANTNNFINISQLNK